MIENLARAFGELGNPRVRGVIWISIALTIAFLAVLVVLVMFGLDQIELEAWAWLETAIDVVGAFGAVVLAIFLFPAVIGVVSGMFLERVADAVEKRHYPHLPPAREQGVGEVLSTTLVFLLAIVVLNLMALLLSWILPIALPIFLVLNGYLLGREYFELVALRRLPPAEARDLRRRHRGRILVSGLAIAVLLMIPLVNLLAAILATAFMVNEFQLIVKKV